MLEALRFAFSFLTRLPVGFLGSSPGPIAPQVFGRAALCFPLVGAVVGALCLGFQALVLDIAGLPLTGILLVALLALITGGLHLDGLADTFDGLGGYHGDRGRMLEIMRDPRIGAHGAIALILVLVTKISVLSELLEHGLFAPLIASTMWSRCAVLPLFSLFPYARPDGLGVGLQQETRPLHVLIATLLTLAVLCAISIKMVLPAAYALLVALALGFWIFKRLGGLTGDVYGAAIELSELTFLIACQLTFARGI